MSKKGKSKNKNSNLISSIGAGLEKGMNRAIAEISEKLVDNTLKKGGAPSKPGKPEKPS